MKITVLGSGAWGTALALLLLENGNDVTLWSYTEEESAVLRETHENPMLKGVPLPEGLKLTTDMAAVKGCGLVVVATPSFAVRSTAKQLRELADPGTILVSVSKGIEKDSSLRLSQVIEEEVQGKCPVVVLSGPSHAEEVGRKIPTGVVVASEDLAVAEQVQDLFMNQRFRVYTSDDKIGTEICAALKNIIALCAGCCDGMGYGDNTKALCTLFETCNPVMGGYHDKITEELFKDGVSPNYLAMHQAGLFGGAYEFTEEGWPIEKRTAYHMSISKEIINCFNEMYPDKPLKVSGLPDANEMIEKGLEAILKPLG